MPDVLINISGGATQTLVATPTSPQFVRILNYHISASAATEFYLFSGPNLIDAIYLNSASPVPVDIGGFSSADGVVDGGIGQPLYASGSTSANIIGTLRFSLKGAGG